MPALRRVGFGGLALLFLFALSCSKSRRGTFDGGVTPVVPPVLALQPVSTAFTFPTFLTSPPADTARLFVLEKAGQIRILKSGVLLPTPFLDLSAIVSSSFDESGLLGLAFYPDYATSGRFLVNYVDLSGNSRIVRYHRSANPDVAVPTPDALVLALDQTDFNHYGGMIAFGPDGMLWVGVGDGTDLFDHQGNGQSRTDLYGSILRIDVSGGGSGYAIPSGNPFTMPAGAPEVWNTGLRNPWRFSFDRATGDLYIGDVGLSDREEIDVARASRGRDPGANYGWAVMEGSECYDGTSCDPSGMTLPTFEYDHTQGCAVTGGYVYRGAKIPALRGTYLFADYCGHVVRSFKLVAGTATEDTVWPALDPGSFISSFGEDARGELYVLTDTGEIYRIVAT